MSEQLTPDSFDTALFVTEMEQLPAIWDSRSSSYRNKQENICKPDIVPEFFFFFLFMNSVVQQCKLVKFLLYIHCIY